jgi:hypothetical protein
MHRVRRYIYMNKNTKLAAAVIALILITGIGWWAFGQSTPAVPTEEENTIEEIGGWKDYKNDELAISFKYPPDYHLEEKTINTAQRLHKQIILTESEPPRGEVAGEGPVSITIDIHQNNLDKQTALRWAQNTSASNFKLMVGDYATTTLYDREAVAYSWDGLYQGDTIAVATDRYVYAWSATYIGPEDEIRQNFVKVLATTQIK